MADSSNPKPKKQGKQRPNTEGQSQPSPTDEYTMEPKPTKPRLLRPPLPLKGERTRFVCDATSGRLSIVHPDAEMRRVSKTDFSATLGDAQWYLAHPERWKLNYFDETRSVVLMVCLTGELADVANDALTDVRNLIEDTDAEEIAREQGIKLDDEWANKFRDFGKR